MVNQSTAAQDCIVRSVLLQPIEAISEQAYNIEAISEHAAPKRC